MVSTERLVIKPLNLSQLKKYTLANGSLEEELNINYITRAVSPGLKAALEYTIIPNMADMNHDYLFYTLWVIISKDTNHLIGDLCFIGEPNEEGAIEIGYGIYEMFRNKGYMREAISGMICWAGKQEKVKSIIAHTMKSNHESYALLIKNNFRKIDEMEFLYKWQVNLSSPP